MGFLLVGGSRDISPVLLATSSMGLATAVGRGEQKLRARNAGLKFKRFVYGGPFTLVGEFVTKSAEAKEANYVELNSGQVVDLESLEQVVMPKNPLARTKWEIVEGASSGWPTWNEYYSSILDNRPVAVLVRQ